MESLANAKFGETKLIARVGSFFEGRWVRWREEGGRARRRSREEVSEGWGEKGREGRKSGVAEGLSELNTAARRVKTDAVVWRGDAQLPLERQGVRAAWDSHRATTVRGGLHGEETSLHSYPSGGRYPIMFLLMCGSTRAICWL